MRGIRNIYEYMGAVISGSQVNDFIGNYSASEVKARHDIPYGEIHDLYRIIISAEDTSGMKADEYGNLGAALTNGITMSVEDDNGTLLDITAGVPIKTNAQWAILCYDADIKAWGGASPTNDLLVVRFTFERSGEPIIIHGHPDNNRRFIVSLNDNFTGLIHHRFMLQGIRRIDPDVNLGP